MAILKPVKNLHSAEFRRFIRFPVITVFVTISAINLEILKITSFCESVGLAPSTLRERGGVLNQQGDSRDAYQALIPIFLIYHACLVPPI
jgi:hypothetical protein